MQEGRDKYGPYNWRSEPVGPMAYIAAAKRHLSQYQDGEEIDPKSGYPHLGHAIASIGIIIDALETGNLIDDRPPAGNVGELIRKWTKDAPKEQMELPLDTFPGADCHACNGQGLVGPNERCAECDGRGTRLSVYPPLKDLSKLGYWNDPKYKEEHGDMLKDVPAHDRIIPRF
jgi:hypothetical protein